MKPPDPAAVDAAIARVTDCRVDARHWSVSASDAYLLADACEHYRQQLAAVTARAERMRKAAETFISDVEDACTDDTQDIDLEASIAEFQAALSANQEGNADG